MDWKQFLKILLHTIIGAGAAAGAAYIAAPSVNPIAAAAIASAVTSLGSAYAAPPNSKE